MSAPGCHYISTNKSNNFREIRSRHIDSFFGSGCRNWLLGSTLAGCSVSMCSWRYVVTLLQVYLIVFVAETVSYILSPLAVLLLVTDFEWLARSLGFQSKKELWLQMRSQARKVVRRVIDILPKYA